MVGLKENINDFLYYLEKIKAYSSSSIETYKNVLFEMSESSYFYQKDTLYILDITPFKLKNHSSSKKIISKKLSAIRSFIKFMNRQKEIEINLIGNVVVEIKVPKVLPQPIDNIIVYKIFKECNHEEKLIVTLLYGLGLSFLELSLLELSDISEERILVKEREIPLLPQLYKEIKSYQELKEPQKFLLEKNQEAMSISRIHYLCTKVFTKSGVNATFHQLQHSFTTYLLHDGVKVSDVSELLKHDPIISTQMYTQLENSKKLNKYITSHPLCDDKNSKGE